jgi:hypothetical protein
MSVNQLITFDLNLNFYYFIIQNITFVAQKEKLNNNR